MSIYDKLMNIQGELKAPKNQHSDFGDYDYRSCEDILEALKPFLKKEGCILIIPYEPVVIEGWRYIKATATLISVEGDGKIECSAYAREPESKPKMDNSQVTGSASTYAKKYALNNLFCIDDTRDADADGQKKETGEKCGTAKPVNVSEYMDTNKISPDKVCKKYKVNEVSELSAGQIKAITDKKNLAYFQKECGV